MAAMLRAPRDTVRYSGTWQVRLAEQPWLSCGGGCSPGPSTCGHPCVGAVRRKEECEYVETVAGEEEMRRDALQICPIPKD